MGKNKVIVLGSGTTAISGRKGCPGFLLIPDFRHEIAKTRINTRMLKS